MADDPDHPIHSYIDENLDLKTVLYDELMKKSPTQFE